MPSNFSFFSGTLEMWGWTKVIGVRVRARVRVRVRIRVRVRVRV